MIFLVLTVNSLLKGLYYAFTGRKLFRLQALGLCVALSLGNPIALVYAADVIQFNTDVLDINDRKNIDLSQFTRSGYIMPGVYTMVVHVNKNDLPEQPVTFMAPENDQRQRNLSFAGIG